MSLCTGGLGLILMIISCGEVHNLLDSNIASILRVLGATLMFIGTLLKKNMSRWYLTLEK